jgi:hypothetical protein
MIVVKSRGNFWRSAGHGVDAHPLCRRKDRSTQKLIVKESLPDELVFPARSGEENTIKSSPVLRMSGVC